LPVQRSVVVGLDVRRHEDDVALFSRSNGRRQLEQADFLEISKNFRCQNIDWLGLHQGLFIQWTEGRLDHVDSDRRTVVVVVFDLGIVDDSSFLKPRGVLCSVDDLGIILQTNGRFFSGDVANEVPEFSFRSIFKWIVEFSLNSKFLVDAEKLLDEIRLDELMMLKSDFQGSFVGQKVFGDSFLLEAIDSYRLVKILITSGNIRSKGLLHLVQNFLNGLDLRLGRRSFGNDVGDQEVQIVVHRNGSIFTSYVVDGDGDLRHEQDLVQKRRKFVSELSGIGGVFVHGVVEHAFHSGKLIAKHLCKLLFFFFRKFFFLGKLNHANHALSLVGKPDSHIAVGEWFWNTLVFSTSIRKIAGKRFGSFRSTYAFTGNDSGALVVVFFHAIALCSSCSTKPWLD